MKRLLVLSLLTLCCAHASPAQSNRDDYNRFEFYAGYSLTRFDSTADTSPAVSTANDGVPAIFGRRGLNGFDVAATYNVSRYVGVKGQFSAGFAKHGFRDFYPCPPGRICPKPCVVALTCPPVLDFKRDTRLYEFLGGVQLKDNSRATRVKPFAHGLVGVARLNQIFYPNPDDPNPPLCAFCDRFAINDTDIALDLGGGLDLRVNERVGVRAFQLTYNPTFFGTGTQHNVRVGAGLTFR